MLKKISNKMYTDSPYKEIPSALLPAYTANGQIPIFNWWFDGRESLDTPDWNDEYIEKYLAQFNLQIIKRGEVSENYQRDKACMNLLRAFEKYGIFRKNVAVVGSTSPWVEAILLQLGNKVTTVEYNVPKSNKITCISYNDFVASDTQYDCVISYSSVEHSGLGRYGDPLDPDADLKTMEEIYKHLTPNSLCIVGFPVGKDALVWNAHRIYGNIRLPMLTKNFRDLEWFGYEKELLTRPLHYDAMQPVIVLQKKERLFAKYPNPVFVETGTYTGNGVQDALSDGFKRILTYEVAFQHYYKALDRFKNDVGVTLYLKPSQTMYEELKGIDSPITFWLDGCYVTQDSTTSFHEVYCPYLQDLEEIAKHPIKTHTILINDVKKFGTYDFQYLAEQEVVEKILEINPLYKFKYEQENILVAYI